MSRFVVDPFLIRDNLDSEFMAISHVVSPFVSVYAWDDGFGSKFANPATLPTGNGSRIEFSRSNATLMVSHPSSSPYISAYAWSGTGFGSKFADPGSAFTLTPSDVSFNYLNNVVALAASSDLDAVFVNAYAWDDSTGWGTKYADPATLPPRRSSFVEFNNNENRLGDTLAVAGVGSIFTPPGDQPYAYLYEWNAGFGSKYADFATAVVGAQTTRGINFNSIDNAFAFGNFQSQQPYLIHAWTNGTGFGSKFSDPAGYTTEGVPGGVAFSYDNKAFMFGISTSSSPNVPVKAYAWSDLGFGTKYANPSVTESSGTTANITISRRNKYVASNRVSISPYIVVYAWDSVSGFGSRIAAPGSLFAGAGFVVTEIDYSN
jgi:hypothetical protein